MKQAATGEEIRIGTAGWSIPRQHAAETAGDGTHLQRYARVFNCAEINSSFYRPHRIGTWQRWAESVPADYRFSVKMPKAITHTAALSCTSETLQTFLTEVGGLGEKLGVLLVQLPPKLAFDAHRAKEFFTMLRDLYDGAIALEPRHPTWFATEAEDVLQHLRLSRVAADPPRTSHDSKPAGWPALRYYRLHGSPRIYYSSYSDDFLSALAHSIEQDIAQNKTVETWCIFDNTALGESFANARSLQARLAKPDPRKAP